MKIWLPYIRCGSGTDIFTEQLAKGINATEHEAVTTSFPHFWQYFPWRLKCVRAPSGTDIILANSWNGFAFRRPGCKLVTVEHLFVLDPAFFPYRNCLQAIFHDTLVKHFETDSMRVADKAVAVSAYTSRSLQRILNVNELHVILNGIDTDFFCPAPTTKVALDNHLVKLLFVGNMSRRKGADMLPAIMEKLGPGFELNYTSGLRTRDPFKCLPGMRPLGCLNQEQIRDAYRYADILLLPTRLEGLPLVAMEAMACGTPVIASNCASLPEVINDGINGRLCPVDNVEAFTAAVSELAAQPQHLLNMGKNARETAKKRFSLKRMTQEYIGLFKRLLGDTGAI